MAEGHQWSGWPGAYCLRCGVEHVLETAIGENWYTPPFSGQAEVWKSEGHKKLVELCDGTCYADLTPEQQQKHTAEIQELCDKLGIGVHT